nr:copia protein [Tanacetum cinerariifolium]
NPNHVYKLKKDLYGLKQAPRAWYDMLSSFLISQDFSKGSVDPTLFIRRNGNDLLLVQIYVDDIIFAASTPELCDLFANLMCSKFKMSMMGKISFFLGLQIPQSLKGIFINQSKYALESLKKYGFESCDPVDTPMVEKSKLDEDKEGKAVDPLHYRGSAYRKARTCSKKDLSILMWNHSSGSMVSEGFFCCINSICRCGSCWLPRYSPQYIWTMDTTIDQQVARDEAFVPHAKILRIGRSNFRLLSDIKSKESTLQLLYDNLRLTPFFKAFWMDNKKHIVNLESFREMLHICPRLPHQPFVEPPFKEEILTFFRFLGHSAVIKKLTNVNINKLHHPWRSFAAIINKCLVGKSSGYDSLRLSQAQILYGLYHKRNVDFAYLMWEDFVYQVELKDRKKSNEMYYPRFTKVIIHHFMSKDPSIPRRNKFGDLLPIELTNEYIRNSNAYKEYYAVATGVTPPKPKASVQKTRSSFDTTITPPTAAACLRLTTFEKGKQAAKASKAKSLYALAEVAMTEAQQLKLATKRSLQQIHISQASGSGADEGTGSIPEVPDVPTDKSEEEISWNSTDEEGDDDEGKDGDGDDDGDDGEEGDGDDDDDDEDDDGKNDMMKRKRKMNYTETSILIKEGTPTTVAPLPMSAPTITSSTIATITTTQQAPTLLTTAPSTLLQDLPNFGSLFGFNHRLKTLEANFSEFSQTNQFAGAISAIPGIAQADNDEFIKTIDENMQKIIKEQVKEQVKVQVSKILPKIEQTVNEQLEAEVLTRPSNSSKTSYAIAADLSEMELKKILIEKIEGKKRRDDDADRDEEPSAGSDRGSKRRREGKELESASAPTKTATRSADLKYQLEEVYKATTDQLDWVNPEGQQYPHNLLKPLPLIPNNQGRRVIPFDHFINNDLEYLREGASSCKYTISVTKTNAADYGHIKWIEDLIYGFAVNLESARDVYSKRRIIVVTKLKIVEWHSYKHLDWITVRRDDDKLYKFKECDFKRLRIQDIEDMLLLLVQGKMTNLTVEERFAFNVSLRMFTRSIIIQRRVEDLQLGVESYQKKLNLTKPDTYRSDLKRKEAYIAYSNPRGFIYQNKDKKNMLMQIDELHKFSDGTLTDVRTALDDRLKGIRMQYLPQSIWKKSDKDRAAAMI